MTVDYTVLVGLEIHVQMNTASKMFCGCPNRFGDPPNSNVCPVCMGSPGVLPVMNGQAFEYAVKTALALNCRIAGFTKWDRKSYFYPDLPKNYQISQYDLPFSSHGYLEVPLSDGTSKKVRVRRVHLEEDAGKNIHDNPGYTGVDLNRAGVPLMEIVSEPDMNTVEEVMGYARSMQRLVRWLGVSLANMQMGHMRFEPNINLHIRRDEKTFKTPIVEVKNLNSFRALERAVGYEIERSLAEWESRPDEYTLEKLGKQNRGYDDATGQTVFQREKEEAHDYRYFPDPDLMPVEVDAAWLDSLRSQIGELPLARRARYMQAYQLGVNEADVLTQDAPTGDLFDAAASQGADARRCANLLLGRGAAIANERGCTIAEIGVTVDQLTELAKMLDAGEINATAAAKVFDRMIETGDRPRKIAESEGLMAVSDTGEIEKWVVQAIADNPKAVTDVQAGGKKQKKAFGFLLGQVMQQSRGQATPQLVNELLQKKLG